MLKSAAVLVSFLVLTLGTGYLGSVVTEESVGSWYPEIAKPAWTPPDWVFAPVWASIFVLMAIAAWLVWRRSGFTRAGVAFTFFLVQLGLNLGWSVLFFGARRPDAAFFEILLLWCAILATLWLFGRHSPAARLLLVPYLVWVSFAATLNYAIWRLNA